MTDLYRHHTGVTLVLTASLFLPFWSFSPNRVAEPVAYRIFSGDISFVLPAGLLLAAAAAAVLLLKKHRELLPGIILFTALLVLSIAGGTIPREYSATGRIGAGPAFWIWAGTAYLLAVGRKKSQAAVILTGLVLVVFIATGALDKTGPLREFQVKQTRFYTELGTHILLSSGSALAAAAAGIPAGILAVQHPRFRRAVFTVINLVQTIPSLAFFGLMIAPLAWLSENFPFLRKMGIQGVGNFPAFLALTAYAVLPLLRNTYTGINSIPRGAVESGRGMGMNTFQLLRIVELPLALPVIFAGFRIALVQAIGNTVVAALIGAGGLGYFIFQGLGQAAPDLIILGVIPLIILTLGAEKLLTAVENALISPALRSTP